MKRFLLSIMVLLNIWILVGCSSAPSAAPAAEAPAAMDLSSSVAAPSSSGSAAGDVGVASDQANAPMAGTESSGMASAVLDSRKIIRSATLRIEAKGVLAALNTATRLSDQVGGYVVSSRTWHVDNLPYATLSFAVPVDRFEEALTQTRALGDVQDENVSSQDVTSQFVDLEARIVNLEATATRIRTFLEETKNVEEALNVNRELSTVESELEVLKGQRNALGQQTAFSTVNIDFVPVPLVVTTGEVLETVQTWSPVLTFNAALDVLLALARTGLDVLIWLLTLGLPMLLIVGVLWWIVRWLMRIRLGTVA